MKLEHKLTVFVVFVLVLHLILSFVCVFQRDRYKEENRLLNLKLETFEAMKLDQSLYNDLKYDGKEELKIQNDGKGENINEVN